MWLIKSKDMVCIIGLLLMGDDMRGGGIGANNMDWAHLLTHIKEKLSLDYGKMARE